MKKLSTLLGCVCCLTAFAQTNLVTDTLPDDAGLDLSSSLTAANVANVAVNAGQLSGWYADGTVITNVNDLLPLVVQSLTVETADGESVVLDANGIAAIDVSAGSFTFLDEEGEPVNTVTSWNDVIERINWSSVSNVPPANVASIPSASIQKEQLAFDPVAAGGEEGSIQFNAAGQISGNTNYFMHADTGKLAFNCEGGNIFRAYKDGAVTETNLIYVVRRYEDTAEVVLSQGGEEKIRLRGDGTMMVKGTLEVDALSLNGTGSEGTSGWFIPEEGDLSMGAFTQQ
jgi:hypothetical protein